MNKTIRASELFAQSKPEDLCLVDVRTAAEVRAESLPGVIAMPVDLLDVAKLQAALDARGNTDEPVYLVCQSGKRAQIAADKLEGKLKQPVIVIEEGMNAIKQCGVVCLQGKTSAISLERQVRITAGSLVLLGVVLGFVVHTGFFGLSAFVGAGLMFSGITDTCAMGMLIAKAPWNR